MTDTQRDELDWIRARLDRMCEARLLGSFTTIEREQMTLLKRREELLLGLSRLTPDRDGRYQLWVRLSAARED